MLQPVAGVVFALDGVLLGAGDAAFLRTSTLAAAAVGFLPLVWASLAFGWGLAGIWSGLTAFMLVRLVAVTPAGPVGAVGGAGCRAGVVPCRGVRKATFRTSRDLNVAFLTPGAREGGAGRGGGC